MSSTATPHRLLVGLPRSGAFVDLAITVLVLGATVALISHVVGFRDGGAGLDLTGVGLAAGSTLPLIAWRRFPLGVFVATATASVLLAGFGYTFGLALGPAVALYLLAASRGQEAPWTRHTTVTVIALLAAYLGAGAAEHGALQGAELLHAGLPWAVAWFAGERTRLRHARMAELRERALHAERDAERERLLAVAEERARIARDLHDSAGHAINVIAIRAGAARLRHEHDPDRALPALEAIEDLAQQTAADIDEIVGTLRQGGSVSGGVEAPPGLASLDTLIAHQTASGLDVSLEKTGNPRPLGRVADQGAYRILQEALTNAARHGSGRASIELAFGDEAISLMVTNPVAPNGASRPGGGHGLIGICERAALLGGSVEAEQDNGSFTLHARVPYWEHRS